MRKELHWFVRKRLRVSLGKAQVMWLRWAGYSRREVCDFLGLTPEHYRSVRYYIRRAGWGFDNGA